MGLYVSWGCKSVAKHRSSTLGVQDSRQSAFVQPVCTNEILSPWRNFGYQASSLQVGTKYCFVHQGAKTRILTRGQFRHRHRNLCPLLYSLFIRLVKRFYTQATCSSACGLAQDKSESARSGKRIACGVQLRGRVLMKSAPCPRGVSSSGNCAVSDWRYAWDRSTPHRSSFRATFKLFASSFTAA
jgi:hypothetical protein